MTRRIVLYPSCFHPEITVEINVPDGRDDEEYIDELLDGILNEDIRYNCEWEFSD